jgi:hypothetical protein
MGNMAIASNIGLAPARVLRDCAEQLRLRLPSGWKLDMKPAGTGAGGDFDAWATVVAPDRTRGQIAIRAKSRVEPRMVKTELRFTKALLESRKEPVAFALFCPYLSPSSRESLDEAGIGYSDFTGNIRLVMARPAVFLEARGAEENPTPDLRPVRSLRGEKAAGVVRRLIDFGGPQAWGIRSLALAAGTTPAHVSRLAEFMESEALIEREAGGQIDPKKVRWERLLRRWASDAPFERRGITHRFLEPRGVEAFMARLRDLGNTRVARMKYAVTGSPAVWQFSGGETMHTAVIYVDGKGRSGRAVGEEDLGLRPAGDFGNVFLIEADAGSHVFSRNKEFDGVVYAGLSQVAADLLTAPDRGPAEAEALIRWMQVNEDKWRVGGGSTRG